jgi:KDO2-lipid IV(A) lauroyltransferase
MQDCSVRKSRKKLTREIRQVFESIFICVGLVTIPLLPRKMVLWLAAGLGRLAFCAARKLRRITLANLDVAYGASLSHQEKRAVATASFKASALLLLDVFWFKLFVKRRIERFVNVAPSLAPFFDQAPMVGITAHMGNWEVCGLALALRGAPMLSVAAPLNNPFADAVLNRTRRLTGQKVASRRGAVRAMLRELKSGGRVGLLMDQNVTPRKGGVFVDFFGLPVPVSNAAATLSVRSNAPIMVMMCVVDRRGCYELQGCAPIVVGDAGVPEAEATQAMTADIEKMIRKTPGQWFWMYKRWRYVPEDVDLKTYPFYAETYRPPQND